MSEIRLSFGPSRDDLKDLEIEPFLFDVRACRVGECATCKGTGKVRSKECEACEGRGKLAVDPQVFAAKGYVPFGGVVDLARAAKTMEGNPLDRTLGYIEAALANDEERARFSAMIRDPELYVPGSVIEEACIGLVTYYTTRPTQPSSGSSSGGRPTSTRSTGGAGEKGLATLSNGRPT